MSFLAYPKIKFIPGAVFFLFKRVKNPKALVVLERVKCGEVNRGDVVRTACPAVICSNHGMPKGKYGKKRLLK